jgi:hypothetical protein
LRTASTWAERNDVFLYYIVDDKELQIIRSTEQKDKMQAELPYLTLYKNTIFPLKYPVQSACMVSDANEMGMKTKFSFVFQYDVNQLKPKLMKIIFKHSPRT